MNPTVARAAVSGTDRVTITGLDEGTDHGGDRRHRPRRRPHGDGVLSPSKSSPPMSGDVTACRGESVGSLVRATVEATVTANLPLENVRISAYIDSALVGTQIVGDMSGGPDRGRVRHGPDSTSLRERLMQAARQLGHRRRVACAGAATDCPRSPRTIRILTERHGRLARTAPSHASAYRRHHLRERAQRPFQLVPRTFRGRYGP